MGLLHLCEAATANALWTLLTGELWLIGCAGRKSCPTDWFIALVRSELRDSSRSVLILERMIKSADQGTKFWVIWARVGRLLFYHRTRTLATVPERMGVRPAWLPGG